MILPGIVNFRGVSGTTFDFVITLYPSEASLVHWREPLPWTNTTTYFANDGVIGSDGRAYKCLISNTTGNAHNPVTESPKTNWELVPAMNFTGYTGEFKVTGGPTLKSGEAGFVIEAAAGKVKIKMTPLQTTPLTGSTHYSLTLTDTEGNLYEWAKGAIEWQSE